VAQSAKEIKKKFFVDLIVLLAWIGSGIVVYAFVDMYGLPIPYGDEWVNVSQALGQTPPTFHWLWSIHNEHRLPLPRLIYVGLIRLSGNDFRSGMFFNVFGLSALSLCLLVFLRRLRGNTSFTDAFIPICLVNLAHYEILLCSNQIVFVLTTILLCIVLMMIAGGENSRNFPRLFLVAVCLVLLPLCSSCGLVPQVPLLVWLATWTITNLNTGKLSQVQFGILAVLIASATTIDFLYFVNFHPVYFYRSFRPFDIFRGSMEFLATSFGPAGIKKWKISLPILLSLLLSTLWLLVSSWKKNPQDRFRSSGFVMFLSGLLLMMLSVAIGRSGGGVGFAAAHRYALLTANILCLVYMVFTIYGAEMNRNFVLGCLLLLVLLALPGNARMAVSYAENRQATYIRFQKDVQAKLPIQAIATRDGEAFFPFYGPFLVSHIRTMQEYKIGPFALLDPSLPEIPGHFREMEVSLSEKKSPASTHNGFFLELKKPEYLLGFRTSLVIENDSRQPQVFLSWQTASSTTQTIHCPFASSPEVQTDSFWIYDSIKRIEITAPNDRLRLSRMILLLKP
jgi:hypothetical protein